MKNSKNQAEKFSTAPCPPSLRSGAGRRAYPISRKGDMNGFWAVTTGLFGMPNWFVFGKILSGQ